METLEKILSEHSFIRGLDQRYIDLIVGCAANVRFNAGSYIFHEGEQAHQFYIIREGRVALEMYSPGRSILILDTLTEDDILGWSWLIPPFTWHFDAHAVELTRAIALDGKCLRTKCEHDHDLAYELLKRFSKIMEQRLESTRLQLLDIYGNDA